MDQPGPGGLGNKPLQLHRFPPGQEESEQSGLWRVFLVFFLHCDSKNYPPSSVSLLGADDRERIRLTELCIFVEDVLEVEPC